MVKTRYFLHWFQIVTLLASAYPVLETPALRIGHTFVDIAATPLCESMRLDVIPLYIICF
jgi:hypothetical protein